MKIIKGGTIDVRLTTEEFSTLIGLHQELADRGLCPEAKIGDQRDLTELDKYLEFLPRQAQPGEQSVEAKIVQIVGEYFLEITGPQEVIRNVPEQLRHSSWFNGAIPVGSSLAIIRCPLILGGK